MARTAKMELSGRSSGQRQREGRQCVLSSCGQLLRGSVRRRRYPWGSRDGLAILGHPFAVTRVLDSAVVALFGFHLFVDEPDCSELGSDRGVGKSRVSQCRKLQMAEQMRPLTSMDVSWDVTEYATGRRHSSKGNRNSDRCQKGHTQ